MKSAALFERIFLYRGLIDFRKGIDGLASVVESELKLDVFSESLFVFLGKRKDRIKILYWDRTGFALWIKRLEKEKFPWPTSGDGTQVRISGQELEWLLEGINIFAVKPHETLHFSAST